MDDISQKEFHLIRNQLSNIQATVGEIKVRYNSHEQDCREDRVANNRINRLQNYAIIAILLSQVLILGIEYLQIDNINISIF